MVGWGDKSANASRLCKVYHRLSIVHKQAGFKELSLCRSAYLGDEILAMKLLNPWKRATAGHGMRAACGGVSA